MSKTRVDVLEQELVCQVVFTAAVFVMIGVSSPGRLFVECERLNIGKLNLLVMMSSVSGEFKGRRLVGWQEPPRTNRHPTRDELWLMERRLTPRLANAMLKRDFRKGYKIEL